LSSAILYLAIVAIWACVLVPRWLRRSHDNHSGEEVPGQHEEFAEGTGPEEAGGGIEPGADPVAWEDPGAVPAGSAGLEEADVQAEYSSVSYTMTTLSVESVSIAADEDAGADAGAEARDDDSPAREEAAAAGQAAQDWRAGEPASASGDWESAHPGYAPEDWAAPEPGYAAEDWAAAQPGYAAEDWAAAQPGYAAEDWAAEPGHPDRDWAAAQAAGPGYGDYADQPDYAGYGDFADHPGYPGGPSRPPALPASRAGVLRARRRLLTMLLALTIGTAACTVTGFMPWLVLIVPIGLLCLYLLLLREAALADTENACRRAEAHARMVRAARARALREQARQAAAVAAPQPTAQIIDLAALAAQYGDEPYDQYADAEIRAVGD
jgi:hypothetical protein